MVAAQTVPTWPRSSKGMALLSTADVESYDPYPRRSGSRTCYKCPIHGGDHQTSFHVTDEGFYKCHSCGERGRLTDYLTDTPRTAPVISLEALGQRRRLQKTRQGEDLLERLQGELPPAATAFLAHLPEMQAALGDPACPGYQYLMARGLDPLTAATLGAGYAPPGAWPYDYLRDPHTKAIRWRAKVGRIVYPLHDPATGRIVSAIGRLCVDAAPDWSDRQRATFSDVKQRKLGGCPAGVWPYAALEQTRAGRPLALVEGPADALAVAQASAVPALALGSTNVDTIPAALLVGLTGVILALDDDEAGQTAAALARVDLAVAGVNTATPGPGWLGAQKDLGAVAAGPQDAYDHALAALDLAATQLVPNLVPLHISTVAPSDEPIPTVSTKRAPVPARTRRPLRARTDPRVWTGARPGLCGACGDKNWQLWEAMGTDETTQWTCMTCLGRREPCP